jgi:hypothetical protein
VAGGAVATSAWANAVSDAIQQMIAELYPAGQLGMSWANITGTPNLYPPGLHAHTGNGTGGLVDYGVLTGKPTAFPPAGHALDPVGNPAHTGSLPWASVSAKPATFAAAPHALDPTGNPAHTGSLPWASVSGKPAQWGRAGTAAGDTIYGGTAAPASPTEGDIWIKG